jgi:hypothetical protein
MGPIIMVLIEKVFAQNPNKLGTIGSGGGLGAINNSFATSGTGAINTVTVIISAIIGFMTIAGAIWFLFQFLIGGYTWMSSMGDKHRLEEARDRIVNALIGLVIVVAGWAILAMVGQFFGVDFINPQTIISKITF